MIVWITDENFKELEGQAFENGLDIFTEEKTPEDIEYRVDYNSLDPKQKKKLPTIEGEFKVYVNEKSRPPPSLKSRLVKERFFPKKDIIPLLKMILKEKDRDKVFEALMKEKPSPIVLGIWLIRMFSPSKEAVEVLVEAERFTYQNIQYYLILSSKFVPGDTRVKFRFPKKIRE